MIMIMMITVCAVPVERKGVVDSHGSKIVDDGEHGRLGLHGCDGEPHHRREPRDAEQSEYDVRDPPGPLVVSVKLGVAVSWSGGEGWKSRNEHTRRLVVSGLLHLYIYGAAGMHTTMHAHTYPSAP